MAGYLHPDKKPFMYGEWKDVLDALQAIVDAETIEARKKAAPSEKVRRRTVSEIVRRLTLQTVNKERVKQGLPALEFDPSSSTSATRGTRVDGNKLVEKEFKRRPSGPAAPPDIDPEQWARFQLFEKMMASQKQEETKKRRRAA